MSARLPTRHLLEGAARPGVVQIPLQLVSVITEPQVVGTILAHRRKMPAQERELFQERAPPGKATTSHTSDK